MNPDNLWFWVLAGAGALYFIYVFNRLIAGRNACANARAGIDVNLTRRHELIPNLVQVVRGYAAHEQLTLTQVTAARARAVSALGRPDSAAAETALAQSLMHLSARVEAYPELRADGPFIQLMKNLTEAEEQISASRRAFNAHVMAMNNLVQQFPTLIVARVCGFNAQTPYAAGSAAQAAPIISLAT
jgi:LemA protein